MKSILDTLGLGLGAFFRWAFGITEPITHCEEYHLGRWQWEMGYKSPSIVGEDD